jgi:outer membrane protein TolC
MRSILGMTVSLLLAVLLAGLPLGPAQAGELTWSSLKLQLSTPEGSPIQPPAVPPAGVMPLSLRDAIALALKGNLDITVEGFNPQLRQQDLTSQKAVYDPSAFLELDRTNNELPPTLNLLTGQRVLSDFADFNVGLRQTLPTGGTYELRFNNEYNHAPNATPSTGYISKFGITLTQPLLQNFGIEINETNIRIAENNSGISQEQLRLRVSNVVTSIKTGYYDLIFARQNLEVQRRSLQLARDLKTLNQARVRAGVAAPVEVTQAEAQEAAQVQNVINAEKAVQDAEDNLKVIMNLPLSGGWGQQLQPTDSPTFEMKTTNLDVSIQKALENRYEYKSAKLDIDNKDLSSRLARNQTLPNLNFVGSVFSNGFGQNFGKDMSSMGSTDFISYTVGVVLTVPLGNRGPQAAYTKAKLTEEQAKASLKQLELQITQQVRQAVRQLESDAKRIDANRAARVLAEEQLRVETKRLEAGVSTTFNVLSFQRDLAAAQANEIQALTDYNKDLANLDNVTGMVLEANRIQL